MTQITAMMKRTLGLLAPLFIFTLPAQQARADLEHFEYAFTSVCFQAVPDLRKVPEAFKGSDWQGYKGADEHEYEYYSGTTAVFLNAVGPAQGASCTVMDAEVAKLAAEWILELALDKYYPNLWEKGVGYNDQPVWRLYKDNTKTEFYINDGMDGGAGLSLQVVQ